MIFRTFKAQKQFFMVYIPFADKFGAGESLFLSYLLWRQHNETTWVELLRDEIMRATGLSHESQLTVRKRLKKAGVLEEKNDRPKRKVYYRPIHDKLEEICAQEPDAVNHGEPSNEPTPETTATEGSIPANAPGKTACTNRSNLSTSKTLPGDAVASPDGAKKKGIQPLSQEHKTFIEDWHECYLIQFGVNYVMSGGADGKAVKELLARSKLPASDLIAIATLAWRKKGKDFWACVNKSRTIREFASSFNKIVSELQTRQAGDLSTNAVQLLKRVSKVAPEGMKPFSQQPPPGYDDEMNPISQSEWEKRFPLTLYYDDSTLEPLVK